MDDSKMYHMSEDMEDQRLTEDSKIRLYLSVMRYEKPEKRKGTITEKVVTASLALCHSFLITCITGQWVIEAAAECRGYDAIGGEYILIIVIFIGSFLLVFKLMESYRRKE